MKAAMAIMAMKVLMFSVEPGGYAAPVLESAEHEFNDISLVFFGV